MFDTSLLIYKPAHAILTARVIRAANNLKGDCCGPTGIGEDGDLLMRRHRVLEVGALLSLTRADIHGRRVRVISGAERALRGTNQRVAIRSERRIVSDAQRDVVT